MGAVFAAIGRFFTDLLAKIGAVVQWVIDLVTQLFLDAWEFCTDIPVWVFDQVLGVVASALEAVDVPQWSFSFGGLPGELLNVAGLLGLGYCLGIIGAALLVRFAIQTIPFVRWGS